MPFIQWSQLYLIIIVLIQWYLPTYPDQLCVTIGRPVRQHRVIQIFQDYRFKWCTKLLFISTRLFTVPQSYPVTSPLFCPINIHHCTAFHTIMYVQTVLVFLDYQSDWFQSQQFLISAFLFLFSICSNLSMLLLYWPVD